MDMNDWICSSCQKSNNSTELFCGSCRESRTLMDYYKNSEAACSEDFLQMVSRMSEGWECDYCTYINKEDQRACGICDSRRKIKIEPKHTEEWACDVCTYINPEHRRECSMCKSQRKTKMESKHAEYVRQETTNGIRENERRIVLIGKTGAGKSESGNTILGVTPFKSAMRGTSITKNCKKGEALRFEKYVIVIDTPGLFDTDISNEQSTNEIVKCIGMTSPGPHAFILVVQAGRFTNEEKDTVEHFVKHFGDSMYNHLIVLFTRKDDIERSKQTIDDYVLTVPSDLQSILKSCNKRYVAFNNAAEKSCKDKDAERLLDMVETMLQENNGHFYTNELYQEAEKALKRRMDMLRNEEKQKREKEKRKLQEEITAKYESELDCIRQQLCVLEQKREKEKITFQEEIKAKYENEMDAIRQESRVLEQVREEEIKKMQEEITAKFASGMDSGCQQSRVLEQKREEEIQKLREEITAKFESELNSVRQQSLVLEQKLQEIEMKKRENKLEKKEKEFEKTEKELEEKKQELEKMKNNAISQMDTQKEKQEKSIQDYRKVLRDESEKGMICFIIEGIKQIAKGLSLPLQKIFS